MANTAEADLCNVALARIGQRKQITSLDPAVDTQTNAALCALLYPAARKALLGTHRWRFATRAAVVAPDAAVAGSSLALPGWSHAYSDPADLLQSQYVFAGVRPGASAIPGVFGPFTGPPFVSGLPVIGGEVPQAPFAHVGGHIFTDWSDTAPAWDSTVYYPLNFVVVRNGSNYRSTVDSNHAADPTNSNQWSVIAAGGDSSMAQLVYTGALTDVTLFPSSFTDALQWKLAVDLALALATKPELANGFKAAALEALSSALAAEGNGQQRDPQPASRYITARW